MSNYLQLFQDAVRECGVSSTVPATAQSQTGELARVAKWVIQSWTEIQASRTDWRWMRSEFTLSTSSGDDQYAYSDCTDSIASATITRFARWLPSEFQIYLTSAGVGTQRWLTYYPWDQFKRVYKIGTQNNSAPVVASIDPRNNLRLGPKPDAAYTVTGEYQKSPQTLSANADEPEMPAQFHQLIVYKAMEKYAGYSGAAEVWARVQNEAQSLRLALEADQLPLPNFGSALA